jgi:hypothetical protein
MPGLGVSHAWQTSPNNGWSEWRSLGAPEEPLRDLHYLNVARDPAGNLGVFALGENESVGNEGDFWHSWRENDGSTEWRNLGHPGDSFGGIIEGSALKVR